MSTATRRTKMDERRDDDFRPKLKREQDGKLTFFPGDGRAPTKDCRIARCFPWTEPDRFISIRDKEGNELHLFGSIENVPAESRGVVEDELRAQEFVPRIRRVHAIDDTFEIMIWKADTDRGPVEFQVKDDEDIRVLGDDYVVVKDHTGMLFEIPDLRSLDERSRGLVEDRLG
ncbi:MAG: DUF1854 domain-containing protein [Phycisphaerae bacterium]|nr:DUF1854 domain-containing protein [Phycisphaerae bacterium]